MNAYSWGNNATHTGDAIETTQQLSNFLAQEARKSHHHFVDDAVEKELLIYNFEPVGVSYQTYEFPKYDKDGASE